MDAFDRRRTRLLRTAEGDAVDGYLITHPVNVAYLTGRADPGAVLVVGPKRSVVVLAPSPGEPLVVGAGPAVDVRPVGADESVERAIGEAARKAGTKAVGVEGEHLPVAAFERLAAVRNVAVRPTGRRVEALRAIKDPGEVEEVRAAARVADRAYAMFAATVREGDTETDMASAVDGYVRRAGGRGGAVATRVLCGERGAEPLGEPGDTPLAAVSKCVVDFTAVARYACRLARTFRSPFPLAPTRRNKGERVGHDLAAAFAAVLAAQREAMSAARDGTPVREVYAAARRPLADAGYGDYVPPVLGHGTGLEAVEGPLVRGDADDTLEAGAVLTIAPAVLIPGWGAVRVADCVLVTRDRAVPLTTPRANVELADR